MKKIIGIEKSAILLAISLVVLPVSSRAATPIPPSSTQPGVIMRGLEGQNPTSSNAEGVIVIPKEEAANKKKFSDVKAFVLRKVILDKPNVYTPEILYNMYKDMVGQKVSFADLNEIAQRVTKKYREDGYIFSRAVLPPQKVVDGVVHLRAIEGRIAHVKLVGHYTDKNGLIQKFADQISTTRAANSKEIERYLLLINDLPGVTARSLIKPSEESGGGDLIIDVEEKSNEGSVSVDNRGSRYLGPYRGTAVGALNDMFGLHDRTTLRGIITSDTKELRFGDISHEEQIGDNGAKITARAAITSSEPGGNIASQDIKGDSQMYDLEGVYPVVRSRQYNFNLVAGFNALNSTTDVSTVQTALDRVRTARVGTRFDLTDTLKGVNQFELMATQSLHLMGATEDGVGRSRANGHEEFLKGDLTATRVQQLPDLWSVMVSGTGQVANHPLLASEEFTIGGPTYGRAYDTGEMTGDNGYAGVAELRYGGPVESNKILQSYQAYTFIDYGKVTNQDPAVGEAARDSLTSAGLGVRFNLQQDFSSYVELDKPMNKPVASEGDTGSRLFFSVLKRF